jgi:hypothetical protein
MLIQILRGSFIPSKRSKPAPALGSIALLPFVNKEMSQGRQQEGTEFASLSIGCPEVIFAKKLGEKGLRQVLGVMR